MKIRTVIPVKQVLSEKNVKVVYSVSPQTLVIDALMMMDEKKIGSVVVMEEGKIVGLFSEREYARKGIIKGRRAKATPVSEVMNSDVTVVTPDMDVNHCMELFLGKQTRYLPVVHEDAVIGLVSMGDVMSSMINNQRNHIEYLEKYITGY